MTDSTKPAQLDELLEGQNRYTRPSAGAPVDKKDQQTEQVDSFQSTALSEDLLSGLPAWSPASSSSSRFQIEMPDATTNLPNKESCDILVDAFVNYYHPVAPLIHVPTFLDNYELFWQTRNNGPSTIRQDASFLALLFAILHAGAALCEADRLHGIGSAEDLCREFYKSTTKALRFANFPRTPTIQSLAAYLVSQSLWMTGKV